MEVVIIAMIAIGTAACCALVCVYCRLEMSNEEVINKEIENMKSRMPKEAETVTKNETEDGVSEECIVIHGPNSAFAKRPVYNGQDVNKEIFKQETKAKDL